MLRLPPGLRDSLLRTLVIVAGGWPLACSDGKETTPEEHPFTDEAGRVCRATLEKAEPESPSISQSVSCEGGSKQCSVEAQPCFALNVEADHYGVMNCPACCKGSASSFVSSECSQVTCGADLDCIYNKATCQGGVCVCPRGDCE